MQRQRQMMTQWGSVCRTESWKAFVEEEAYIKKKTDSRIIFDCWGNSNCEEWILLQSTVEPICVSFLIVPIAFGRIMSDWWKCNPSSSWFDRKEDYGFGVNLSLPLMVIIDDFPLSFLDKKAIINISIWGFHTSAVSCVLCFHHCNWFLILCLHTLYFYVGTNIASAERETMFGYRGRKITAR